jgi:competence protein ComGC
MKKLLKLLGGQSIVLIIVSLVIILSAYNAMSSISSNRSEESIKALEDALMKASVQCYALEGGYPPDLEYLSDNYGVILDLETYYYHYDLQGSNIAPMIKVIKR